MPGEFRPRRQAARADDGPAGLRESPLRRIARTETLEDGGGNGDIAQVCACGRYSRAYLVTDIGSGQVCLSIGKVSKRGH